MVLWTSPRPPLQRNSLQMHRGSSPLAAIVRAISGVRSIVGQIVLVLATAVVSGCGGDSATAPGTGPEAEGKSSSDSKGGSGNGKVSPDLGANHPANAKPVDAKIPDAGKPKDPSVGPGALTADPASVPTLPPLPQVELPAGFRDHVSQRFSKEPAVREKAAAWLAEQPGNLRVMLLQLVGDKSSDVRCGAIFSLLEFDANDPYIAAALIGRLADDDPRVRHLALQGSQSFSGEHLQAAVAPLGKLLERPGEEARNQGEAARILGGIGPSAAAALPAIRRIAQSDVAEMNVRRACWIALSSIAKPEDSVPELATALTHAEPEIRLTAIARLRHLGLAAAGAANNLAGALEDSDPKVRDGAKNALIPLGGIAVEPVAAKLGSSSVETRRLALFILGKIGPAALPAAPQIQARLADDDPEVRQLATLVLKLLGVKPSSP